MQSTSFNSPSLLSYAIALTLACWSQGNAQTAQTPSTCAIHFQARADWMRGLDGNPETIGLMETYSGIMERHAEALWLSQTRDWGMRTGVTPGANQLQHRKSTFRAEVLDQLTAWAETDHSGTPRPLCMQDTACIQCTALLRKAVNTHD